MKRGFSLLILLSLVLTSYGCVVETRDDEYRRNREEYREHEEHREDRDRDRDYDEHRRDEEQRDYDQH